MYIAVDDTDSRDGLCTTFLATQIINGIEWDLIGYPSLVRLNPAVPWKTRGNAALVLQVGKGSGEKVKIGEISGKDIFAYPSSTDEPDQKKLLDAIVPILTANRMDDSQSGLIVSSTRPDPSLYWEGVRTILQKDTIMPQLEKIDASVYTIGDGQGVVGAACAMSWVPKDMTYELTAYRQRDRWGTERKVDPSSIRKMDHMFVGTFNSWEERFHKVTMVPSTPCPVLYGIRGDDPAELQDARSTIVSEEAERWIIFRTNQGTDDHITEDPDVLVPDRSYSIEGIVRNMAEHIKGGHVLMDIDTSYGIVTIGAYEPSKEFRMLFDHLIPGDRIRVMGELRDQPRTLNAEKVHVISLADDFVKISNPVCPSCGKRMKSIGKDEGYRCRECHTRSRDVSTVKRTRWVVPGWYEPPAAARRHLSRPLKRTGIEQPIEFVNSRIV